MNSFCIEKNGMHIQDYPRGIDHSEQKHHFKPVPFRRDLLIQLPHEFLTTRNDRENCGLLSHMALSETCGNHNVLWLIMFSPLKSHKFEVYPLFRHTPVILLVVSHQSNIGLVLNSMSVAKILPSKSQIVP